MCVRKHALTGVVPKWKSHACTEACSDRGTTLMVSTLYGGMCPTVVAPKRRFSCLYGGMLRQG